MTIATSNYRKPVRGRALVSALMVSSALCTSPALAFDATGFFAAIQQEAAAKGDTLTFGSVESNGGEGAHVEKIKLVEADGKVLTIESLDLTGAEITGDEGFRFDSLQAYDIVVIPETSKSDDAIVRLGQLTATGFALADKSERSKHFWPLEMKSGRIEDIQISGGAKDNASLVIPSISITDLIPQGGEKFKLGAFEIAASTGSFANENGANGAFSFGASSASEIEYFGLNTGSLGKIEIGNFDMQGNDEKDRAISANFAGASGENIYSPDYSIEGPINFPDVPMKLNVGGAELQMDSKTLFSLGGMIANGSFDNATRVYDSSFSLSDLFVDLNNLPLEPGEEDGKNQLIAMGYDTLNFGVDLQGTWNLETGTIDVSKYRFSGEDMAALDIGLTISGYGEEMARKIQKISTQMNNTKDQEAIQMHTMQLFAEASALTVDAIKIEIEDDSLTNKLLDMQAKNTGQQSEEIAAMMPMMAGAMLSQFNIPEFAASASAAIGSFLQSPGTITLSAKPDEPVSVAELMGIAGGVKAGNIDPAELIERFNVEIIAK